MINLNISFLPKRNKKLELSQLLKSLLPKLEKTGTKVQVTEKDNKVIISIQSGSAQNLKSILHSKEIRVLSGSISLLGEDLKIFIRGNEYKLKGSDLSTIQLKED